VLLKALHREMRALALNDVDDDVEPAFGFRGIEATQHDVEPGVPAELDRDTRMLSNASRAARDQEELERPLDARVVRGTDRYAVARDRAVQQRERMSRGSACGPVAAHSERLLRREPGDLETGDGAELRQLHVQPAVDE